MHRSPQIFLLPILFLSVAFRTSVAQEQKKHEPLTEGAIINLIQGGVPPERVAALAREFGIVFQMTPCRRERPASRGHHRAAYPGTAGNRSQAGSP
jgi:hypothetical protein